MKELTTITSILESEKVAGKYMGFVRKNAYFQGRVLSVIPSKETFELVLENLRHRRSGSRWESDVNRRKAFIIPITTRFWRPDAFSGIAFQFCPWLDQGVFIGFITAQHNLELGRKYCRHT